MFQASRAQRGCRRICTSARSVRAPAGTPRTSGASGPVPSRPQVTVASATSPQRAPEVRAPAVTTQVSTPLPTSTRSKAAAAKVDEGDWESFSFRSLSPLDPLMPATSIVSTAKPQAVLGDQIILAAVVLSALAAGVIGHF